MIFGCIPAGGKGTRLKSLGYSKELALIQGRPVIEHLINRMINSGVDKIFISTSPDKLDLIEYLSTESPYSDNLMFIIRERKGLLHAVTAPHSFIARDDYLAFGLPDTIWFPENAFESIINFRKNSSLTLGLFDSGKPESYDSVVIDENGKIKSVEVKVANPKSKWTWGIGIFKASIAPELIRLGESQNADYPLLGQAIHDYSREGDAYALELQDSSYIDIGTPEDFARARKLYT